MTRWCAVKSEHEHHQDACMHVLEPISEQDRLLLHTDGERDYRWTCTKCGKALKNLNGVVRKTA